MVGSVSSRPRAWHWRPTGGRMSFGARPQLECNMKNVPQINGHFSRFRRSLNCSVLILENTSPRAGGSQWASQWASEPAGQPDRQLQRQRQRQRQRQVRSELANLSPELASAKRASKAEEAPLNETSNGLRPPP